MPVFRVSNYYARTYCPTRPRADPPRSGSATRPPGTELQRRSSKVLEKRSLTSLLYVWNLYQPSTTLGLELVSIVHYTRPGSSIKRPTPNYLATQRPVNWPVVYTKSSYKIMDPAALPKYFRRFFVATLQH